MPRVAWLEEQIEKHNKAYWRDNDPQIPDEEYDALCEELRLLQPGHPLLTRIPDAAPEKTAEPMLSLQKAYTKEALCEWAGKVARCDDELFYAMPKYDGVASQFLNGCLETRQAQDITDKIPFIDFSRISKTQEERGEIVVCKSVLPSLPGGYKTCRAAAVGLLGSKTLPSDLGKPLVFMPHTSAVAPTFTLPQLKACDWEQVADTLKESDFPSDGIVIGLLDSAYSESLGATEHHPNGVIALKYKNPTGVTKLLDVVTQPGRDGRLTPVAVMQPVAISGCEHTYASLHNWGLVEKMCLTLGARIEVARAGDVIPQVVRVVKNGSVAVQRPAHCPICGSRVTNVKDHAYCSNSECGGVAAKRLLDTLRCLEIEAIGVQTVNALISMGVKRVEQVFAMTWEAWLEVPGFAEGLADRAVKQLSLRRAAPIEDWRILAAMLPRGVGPALSKLICLNFDIAGVPAADLRSLPGIDWLRQEAIREAWDSAFFAWALTEFQVVFTKGLEDKPTVVFTGAHEFPRSEWIKLAEAAGWRVLPRVVKNLTLLVAASVESTSTKARAARKYNIGVVTYGGFKDRLENEALDKRLQQ